MAKTLLVFLFVSPLYAFKFKVGDLLLQPLHCRLCNLIEGETNSEYSHIGIVLQTHPKVYVGEAFQKVRAVTLNEFLKKTQKHHKVRVVRPNGDFRYLKKAFRQKYEGKPYDAGFLWGDESLYCSELTWKLLRHFTRVLPQPKPMTFEYKRREWYSYFKGKIPDAQIGIAPADFERFFKAVGEL